MKHKVVIKAVIKSYSFFFVLIICLLTQNISGQVQKKSCNLSVGFTNITSPNCYGGSNGTATTMTSGQSGTVTFTWTPYGGNANMATGLSAGSYTITVNDSLGCSSSATGTINDPTPVQFTNSVTNVSCNGGTTGSISLIPTGGSPNYTYSWQPMVSTNQVATSLTAGDYIVIVMDSKNCSTKDTITVTEPQSLSFTLESIPANCGLANGIAFIDHNGDTSSQYYGGTSPYSIFWNPTNQLNDTAKNLSSGNYVVNVYDANNCFASNTISVGIIPKPSMVISTASVICHGAQTGMATVTVASGTSPYSYTWNTNPPQYTPTATNLAAGTYTIQVKDNLGCAISNFANITQPNALINNLTVVSDSTNGLYYHFSNSTNGNNLTYLWFFGDGDTSSLQNPTHLYNIAGSYTVKLIATSTTCEDSISQIINVTPTGIHEQTNVLESIRTYPNPFSDNTTFKIEANKFNEVYSFELTDDLGKNVKSLNCFSEKQFVIDRSGLQNGIYFYKILSSGGIIGYGKLKIQ